MSAPFHSRTATVYRPDGAARLLSVPEALEGAEVLPGFRIELGSLLTGKLRPGRRMDPRFEKLRTGEMGQVGDPQVASQFGLPILLRRLEVSRVRATGTPHDGSGFP